MIKKYGIKITLPSLLIFSTTKITETEKITYLDVRWVDHILLAEMALF